VNFADFDKYDEDFRLMENASWEKAWFGGIEMLKGGFKSML
jgi:hypothetical protein